MLQGYFDDDGRPMLEAVVKLHDYGIRAVPFVVDTGADSTVLSFQDAKEIGPGGAAVHHLPRHRHLGRRQHRAGAGARGERTADA